MFNIVKTVSVKPPIAEITLKISSFTKVIKLRDVAVKMNNTLFSVLSFAPRHGPFKTF